MAGANSRREQIAGPRVLVFCGLYILAVAAVMAGVFS